MPKITPLRPLDVDEKWKRQAIHFNREQWDEVMQLAALCKLNDLSAVVHKAIEMAILHFKYKDPIVKEIKKKIELFQLKHTELFV